MSTSTAIDTVESLPSHVYKGRGIVTASCSRMVFQSLVSLSILRDRGCDLPIELFYADDEELTTHQIQTLVDRIGDVVCMNIQTACQLFKSYNARNFSIKALATYLSSFDEMIWMDADVVPLTNMTMLFHTKHYIQNRALFFNDIFSYGKHPNDFTKRSQTLFETTCGQKIDAGTPETDSGVFVLQKSRFGDFVHHNTVLNMKPYTETYGDKELYRMAMNLASHKFHNVEEKPIPIGKYFEIEDLFCGNGVIFETEKTQFCVHMTLHNVNHVDKYKNVWKDTFWTHCLSRDVDVVLQIVKPINQEIIVRFPYDKRFVKEIPQTINTAQTLMYKYINRYRQEFLT